MKIFKGLTVFTIVMVLGAVSALSYSHAAQAVIASSDFVQKASEANLFEIQSSKLAISKSRNSDVKTFALNMVDDHTAAGENLKSTLSSANEDTGQIATQMNAKHQKIMDKLNAVSGDDFDKQYVSAQKDAHNEAVKLFKDYSNNGDDAALKAFAAKTLPVLQKHLAHVKQLSASM